MRGSFLPALAVSPVVLATLPPLSEAGDAAPRLPSQ
ncbi:MAG: hypothetical protein AW07_04084 [Candidatus Accumulibacter sp. SK-11]|nr:MAG: hypothetical protein AW07_04084 [Candidatus Accumulibacter sp. SK-11]